MDENQRLKDSINKIVDERQQERMQMLNSLMSKIKELINTPICLKDFQFPIEECCILDKGERVYRLQAPDGLYYLYNPFHEKVFYENFDSENTLQLFNEIESSI